MIIKEGTDKNQLNLKIKWGDVITKIFAKKNVILFLSYNLFLIALFFTIVYFLPDRIKQEIVSSGLIDENASNNLSENIVSEMPLRFSEVLKIYKNSVIYISAKDDASRSMPDKVRNELEAKGSTLISKLGYRQSYGLVIDAGKVVKEVLDSIGVATIRYNNVVVESSGYKLGTKNAIFINGINVSPNKRGFNVVVVNKESGEISRFTFDFFAKKFPIAYELPKKLILDDLSSLKLSITEKNFLKLSKKRDEALTTGVLLTNTNDFVNASVMYKGESYKVEVRLKGDWVDHLQGNKWSFRIKVKGDKTIMGMKKFSVHHPKTRNYLGEWIFHKALKNEDVINLRYSFLSMQLEIRKADTEDSILNLGIYALEESFTKYLIENNRYREGVIVKFDEDPMWKETSQARKLGLKSGLGGNGSGSSNLTIVPFSKKKVLESANLTSQFKIAKNLMYKYQHRKLPLDQVFNIEKLARFNAISNLFGADHGLGFHNTRMYYNPITSRLEPIGFDGNSGHKIDKLKLYFAVNKNLEFYREYAGALERISKKTYLDSMWNGLTELKIQTDILSLEFPKSNFEKSILEHNQAVIKNKIYPATPFHAFLLKHSNQKLVVEIKSISSFPIQILNITYKNKRIISEPDTISIVKPKSKLRVEFNLPEGFKNLFVNKKKGKVVFMADDLEDIVISYRTYGTNKVFKREILPWTEKEDDFVANDIMRKPANINEFDFLVINKLEKRVLIKTGKHILNKVMIIPKGYVIEAESNFELDIIDSAKIISYSAFQFDSNLKQIKFYSSDNTGQGILILNASQSILENVLFDNLHNPSHGDWGVSGAVNFYESPVSLINVTFSNNHSEDALNIIRSSFEIDNAKFFNTYSDAFDGDYVTGTIANSTFDVLGNDAIDISGSDLVISNITISNAGDKGLSAGEKSKIKADDISIEKSEIAIASKDLSSITIEGLNIKDCKLGFTAFQKKSEFGEASIEINQLVMNEVDDYHLIEFASSLTIDGVAMKTSKGVKNRMYGVEYGKSSK
jgi:interleukin-like EMT inducer protein